MDITEKIQNAIEWANKRLILQGQELSQEQKNYLTFALSHNFTDTEQDLQLLQPDVIKSVCKNCNQPIEMHSTVSKICHDRFQHYE